ncbi:hypothetical protein [Cryptosporangium sp. NPDC051539]|uniref:hypothetical protein n=1 Tax=Cryptosporangium sp. NPDC051539 TaxID=3363962 RepID=UPI0037AD47B8
MTVEHLGRNPTAIVDGKVRSRNDNGRFSDGSQFMAEGSTALANSLVRGLKSQRAETPPRRH